MHRTSFIFSLLCSLLFLGLGPWATSSYAQNATVRGFITDRADGEGLQGVNVLLIDDAGQRFGTASDYQGFYALSRIPPGRYTLRASYIGYDAFERRLFLEPSSLLLENIELQVDATTLEGFTIETERETGAANVTAGVQTVRGADIKLVPTPDVSSDLASYLTTLPGVVTTGEQGGQFYVRGGEPAQNLVLLDGMVVYQPFHILGFFSAFPGDIVNRASIHAGGYRGRFGGRISSVIDVAARNGNKRALRGGVSFSPFMSGLLLEGPLNKDRNTSFLASARYSLIEQTANELVRTDLPFQFSDLFFKTHSTFGPTKQLSLTLLRTTDRGTIGKDTGGFSVDEVRWQNGAYGLRYLLLPQSTPMLGEFLINYSSLNSTLGAPGDPLRASSIRRFNTEANLTYFAGNVDVHWGVFARTLALNSKLGGLFQNVALNEEFLTEAGLYAEPEIKVGERLLVMPGLRLHNFPSKSQFFIEPRLRAVFETGIHTLSAATGIYHQELVGLSDRRDAASVFTAWTVVPFGKVPSAFHALLGYQADLPQGVEFAAEGYYKKLSNLFISEWTAFPRFTTNLQQANGRIWGLDLRLELNRSPFYMALSYGLSSVRYNAMQESLPLWFGTDELSFRPPHDRRHQFNALLSTRWNGFDVSARWQFGSGLPYNRAFGFDGFVLLDGPVDVFEEAGSRRVVYERPYNGILPTYHRLDLSVERVFTLDALTLTTQASVINAYDRRNLFYLDVFTLSRVDQLPFIPSVGLKVEFN